MKKLTPFLLTFILLYCSKNTIESSKSVENKIYLKAIDFRNSEKKDSAYIYFARAKEDYLKSNDSLFVAKSLVNMAIIQTDKGDHFGGIETSLEAENYLKRKDSTILKIKSSNYNNLALANAKLKNYENAEKYYFLALTSTNNFDSKLIIYNNIGNNFLDLKNYQKAKEYYLKALKTKDSVSYARALNNLGRCLFEENRRTNVLPYFFKALNIRTKTNDFFGLNSSYGTLADYYVKISLKKSKYYAEKMYNAAKEIKNPDDQLEALQKLIALEPSEKSKFYFSKYQKINDSLQTARSKAKNQFALIRYETEKEKTENAQNKIKILNRNIALLSLFSTIIISIFWYRKRKKQTEREKELLKQEKEIEVKNTQLKFSKKVHDVVANGLYQTMVEIQNIDNLPKENLLDKLENLYEKSRDISNENSQEKTLNFSEKISEMLSSFSCEEIKVLIIGNNENYWKQLSEISKKELFYILRELMVNMKKHSLATAVVLKFEINKNIFSVKYTDNGVGINDFEKKNGSGIQNTENRIAKINGDINFEKNPKGGLIVNMNIPL